MTDYATRQLFIVRNIPKGLQLITLHPPPPLHLATSMQIPHQLPQPIHQIELADESDDIEAVKIVSTKIDSMEMVFSHGEMM